MNCLRAHAPLVILVALVGCGDSPAGSGGAAATASSSTGVLTTVNGSSSTGSSATGSTTGSGTSTTSSGQGGQGVGSPECTADTDCKLVDDCCRCEAIKKSDTAPVCNQQCVQSKCSELALPQGTMPSCVAGRCVAGFECNWNQVACATPSPICPAGQTGSVSGLCYGPCVPTAECASVGSCGQCDGGLACVTDQAQLQSVHCVNLPSQCTGADCACLGPSVCVGAFSLCTATVIGLTCECPTCGVGP